MKKNTTFFPYILMALIFLLRTMNLTALETTKGIQKDYETFRVEMSQKMEDVEKNIGQLRLEAQKKGSKLKKKTVKEIELAQTNLKKKFKELKKDSQDQWSKAKESFSEALNLLHSKVQLNLKSD